jgi:preprotein translocase subunit SecF
VSVFGKKGKDIDGSEGAAGDEVDLDDEAVDDIEDDDVEELDDEELLDEDEDDEEDLGEDLDVDAAARNLLRPKRERAPKPGKPAKPVKVRHGPLARMYRGETRFDFVGRRRVWFSASTLIIVAGIVTIILRGGLNLGIEFKGGVEWTVNNTHVTQTQAANAMQAAGLPSPIVDILGRNGSENLNVQADLNKLSPAAQQKEETKVAEALSKLTGVSVNTINDNRDTVGPTWGSSVTDKAIEALIIFFVVVGIYISIRFEPKMAAAAFIAMIHDVLIAVGVYSIFNFQVTPDTVVAILTILGYSLYDTIVVFDRVRDNTKGIGASGRMSYFQLINLSMNQTLARSINTSMVAILPVLAVLLIGAQFLGAITLQNYGLALFVGLLSGAYSSIFIAAPILAMFKRNESRWLAIENRLKLKGGDSGSALSALDAATMTTQLAVAAGGQHRALSTPKAAKRSGIIRPGSGSGAGGGAGTGTGASQTALMDRPAGSRPAGGSGAAQPRPRKGKGKRKR